MLFFRKGITTLGPAATRALRRKQAHQDKWPFSYSMLFDLSQKYTEDDEEMLSSLYEWIRAGDGVYKKTEEHRLKILDDVIFEEVKKRIDSLHAMRVHDMATSNGITSFDLFSRLASFGKVTIHASDYYDVLYISCPSGSRWCVVFDAEFEPIQFIGPGMVLSAFRREPPRYLVNRLAQSLVTTFVVPRATKLLRAVKLNRDHGTAQLPEGSVKVVKLFHPKCVALAAREPRFTLGRDDLFRPARTRYDIIRIMNALTPDHFETARVLESIPLIASNLPDNGLIVLGRNVDEEAGQLRATIFERCRTKLVPLYDFGNGYELKAPVLDLTVTSYPPATTSDGL